MNVRQPKRRYVRLGFGFPSHFPPQQHTINRRPWPLVAVQDSRSTYSLNQSVTTCGLGGYNSSTHSHIHTYYTQNLLVCGVCHGDE